MAQPADRLSSLTNREKALALKARARHRYTFDLPLDLYETLLNTAEQWDTPLPDVVRACIRKGLEHAERFGTGPAPFVEGKLNPPTQFDRDPTGLAWPPVNNGTVWTPWSEPASLYPVPTIKPGLLPNGATISPADRPEPHEYVPFIPEDDNGLD